ACPNVRRALARSSTYRSVGFDAALTRSDDERRLVALVVRLDGIVRDAVRRLARGDEHGVARAALGTVSGRCIAAVDEAADGAFPALRRAFHRPSDGKSATRAPLPAPADPWYLLAAHAKELRPR